VCGTLRRDVCRLPECEWCFQNVNGALAVLWHGISVLLCLIALCFAAMPTAAVLVSCRPCTHARTSMLAGGLQARVSVDSKAGKEVEREREAQWRLSWKK
jgi:hypothetical protein